MVGDDTECVVIDAPHDVADILAVVGDRKVKAIVCTHAHDDHVRVAPALREEVVAPIMLHPADKPLWELTHPKYLWDLDLADGMAIEVARHDAPGAAHARPRPRRGLPLRARPGCVFTGDTLFNGGPGATGRSYSDSDLIKESIRAKLFALPDDDRGAHRARRRHHDRCREGRPRLTSGARDLGPTDGLLLALTLVRASS